MCFFADVHLRKGIVSGAFVLTETPIIKGTLAKYSQQYFLKYLKLSKIKFFTFFELSLGLFCEYITNKPLLQK